MPVRTRNGSTRTASAKPTKTTTKEIKDGEGNVNYFISITKDLGGFESLKIQAGITLPIGASKEMLEKADELLIVSRDRVIGRLTEDIKDISQSIK